MQQRYEYISEDLLFGCGFQLGTVHDKWKPRMKPYINGFRFGYKQMHVEKAVLLFRIAFRFLKLSSSLKKPGLIFSGLDIEKTLENEDFTNFTNFTNLPANISVLNHRLPGFLTNFSRIIKQYSVMTQGDFGFKLPKKFFPSFGIALTRPLPVSLIQEFRSLSVPLIALVDSDTDCVDDIMFPVISSEASHRFSFIILRAALRSIRFSFKFRKLANYLLLRRRYKFFFKRFNYYLSKKYWRARLPLAVYKRSRRWLMRYKRIRLYRFNRRYKKAFFFFKSIKRRKTKAWLSEYKAARPGHSKSVRGNVSMLLLLRRALRKLYWTRKLKKRLIKKQRKIVLLRKKKRIVLKGMRRFFKKGKKRIKNKRWVRYKGKESSIR